MDWVSKSRGSTSNSELHCGCHSSIERFGLSWSVRLLHLSMMKDEVIFMDRHLERKMISETPFRFTPSHEVTSQTEGSPFVGVNSEKCGRLNDEAFKAYMGRSKEEIQRHVLAQIQLIQLQSQTNH